ncbi:prostaglandin E2 receptor EP3 subtype isoform X2 [Pantherophis guttatus]|uniref:Prostaglandin E2 receptor EP3 subtype n=1 Tax=Pantherophis guttatus TaxID=94885 RepID=A0A6P9DCB3_PANGU|nr:prostaglandin E2 receptor EP3 subtype isoform X2 [Pantherophis guttatus]
MTFLGLYGGRLNSTPFAMAPLDAAGSLEKGNGNGTFAEQCASVSVAFPLTMMITGMVGNGLAMLLAYRAYQKKENQRKRPFLLCIGSLALTDLTGQLLTSPVVITVYLANRKWRAVDPSQGLCAFFGLAMTIFGLCPLFIASAMAVERALAIQAPHWYTGHMKTRLTKMVLLCVWLTSFAFALLPMMGIGKYTLQWPGTWCFISMKDHENARVTMLKVTFNPNPMNQCRESCNQTQSTEQQPECNFSLTHIRLASLNQILDPWVYLLLRKILVQKFCQVARAISCYPQDKWKGQHIILPNKIRRTTV